VRIRDGLYDGLYLDLPMVKRALLYLLSPGAVGLNRTTDTKSLCRCLFLLHPRATCRTQLSLCHTGSRWLSPRFVHWQFVLTAAVPGWHFIGAALDPTRLVCLSSFVRRRNWSRTIVGIMCRSAPPRAYIPHVCTVHIQQYSIAMYRYTACVT
jgi:hypothetical protein